MKTIEQNGEEFKNIEIRRSNYHDQIDLCYVIQQEEYVSKRTKMIYVDIDNRIPFILAFIEESGIDKLKLIRELENLVVDSDMWNSIKNCNHEFNFLEVCGESFCTKCSISKNNFDRLQSKFGDKEGEEK